MFLKLDRAPHSKCRRSACGSRFTLYLPVIFFFLSIMPTPILMLETGHCLGCSSVWCRHHEISDFVSIMFYFSVTGSTVFNFNVRGDGWDRRRDFRLRQYWASSQQGWNIYRFNDNQSPEDCSPAIARNTSVTCSTFMHTWFFQDAFSNLERGGTKRPECYSAVLFLLLSTDVTKGWITLG